jgi:hypothetical protein
MIATLKEVDELTYLIVEHPATKTTNRAAYVFHVRGSYAHRVVSFEWLPGLATPTVESSTDANVLKALFHFFELP